MVEDKQEAQKTLVAFVVGLLIGGMLVWAFSGPTANAPETDDKTDESEMVDDETGEVIELTTNEEEASTEEIKPVLQVGEGKVVVPNQAASMSVTLESVTYPVSEGWIGVRDYNNENLGLILGVVRFSESQGLIPSEIFLQRSTKPGNTYAIVIFTEDGDRSFNLAGDVQIDTIFDTFVAQ